MLWTVRATVHPIHFAGTARRGEVGQLNGAACHACLLVSETSCERGNRYLDRGHLVATVAQMSAGYFDM